jgi:UDP-2-acetamido-2,6-beta-L-arabino-hexul-4-ose reductase
MIKVGITGRFGFIGTHLYNYLGLKENIKRVEFKDEYFKKGIELDNFVKSCDVIVHLAAMNRHTNPQVIYDTNINLVKQLIDSLERTNSNPHIIMASSTQEERDDSYGKSKQEGRRLFIERSEKRDNKFTGMIIPNVFGPFGKPFYNSVVSTFCYQIAHEQKPEVKIDAEMDLIYVQDLVCGIYNIIAGKSYNSKYIVEHTGTAKVTDVLKKLTYFCQTYAETGIFPEVRSYFELCLFNTYRSYLNKNYFPRLYKLNIDERGSFVEVVKALNQGQVSFSTTKPGITRGNHFHTRKIERFAVIKGESLIKLRRVGTDEVIEYNLSGDNPGYVDMPVWYTHNITNIGTGDLYTIFWINELYDPHNPDTYYEEV